MDNYCNHELEHKQINPEGVYIDWWECKKCHQKFEVKEGD